jgi:hypothetical protein
MRSADEKNRAIFRDVECASGSDFSEEDVDDESPEQEDEIVWRD